MPPDTHSQTQNDDASIALNFPDKNYGSDDRLIVHYRPQSSGLSDEIPATRRNVYLKFDISNVLDLNVTSATLKLFCSSVFCSLEARSRCFFGGDRSANNDARMVYIYLYTYLINYLGFLGENKIYLRRF